MKTIAFAAMLLLFTLSAYAQQAQPEQDAVNALGALDVANKAIRTTVSAYAADVGQKMEALKKAGEASQKDADAKDKYWAEYVRGLGDAPK